MANGSFTLLTLIEKYDFFAVELNRFAEAEGVLLFRC